MSRQGPSRSGWICWTVSVPTSTVRRSSGQALLGSAARLSGWVLLGHGAWHWFHSVRDVSPTIRTRDWGSMPYAIRIAFFIGFWSMCRGASLTGWWRCT